MSAQGWATAGVFMLGALLILGGVIGLLVDLARTDRAHRRALRRFDARVGRDCYRDIKGITR